MTDLTLDHPHRPNQPPGVTENAVGNVQATDAEGYLIEAENWDRTVAVQQACKIAGMKRPRAWSTG